MELVVALVHEPNLGAESVLDAEIGDSFPLGPAN